MKRDTKIATLRSFACAAQIHLQFLTLIRSVSIIVEASDAKVCVNQRRIASNDTLKAFATQVQNPISIYPKLQRVHCWVYHKNIFRIFKETVLCHKSRFLRSLYALYSICVNTHNRGMCILTWDDFSRRGPVLRDPVVSEGCPILESYSSWKMAG